LKHKEKIKDIHIEDEKEMSFLEHLEELRWRIIKAVIGIVIGGVLVAIFIDPVINYIIFYLRKTLIHQ